jgi:hypothetical protein
MLIDFRFIRRGDLMTWAHKAEMLPGDVDCTDLDDIELQREVCKALGIFKFCPPRAL